MREEIDPKLEKLRGEKRSYLEYQKATSELERLTRLVKAYEWTLAVDKAEKAAANLKQKQRAIEGAKEEVSRGGREVKGMEKEVEEIQRKREKVRSFKQQCKRLHFRKWPKAGRSRDWRKLSMPLNGNSSKPRLSWRSSRAHSKTMPSESRRQRLLFRRYAVFP